MVAPPLLHAIGPVLRKYSFGICRGAKNAPFCQKKRLVPLSRAQLLATFLLACGCGDITGALFPLRASVTVVSPNGGELWTAGSEQVIRWSGQDLQGGLSVALSIDGGETYSAIASDLSASVTTYPWQVPATPTTNALVRVFDAAERTSDTSNSSFTILARPMVQFDDADYSVLESAGEIRVGLSVTAPGPDLSLTYSVGGDADASDHTLTSGVLFVPGTGSSAEIVFDILDDTASEGDETITIQLDSSDLVSIAAPNTLTITILANDQGPITVLAPTPGETWDVGSHQSIAWMSDDTAPVHLFVSLNDGADWSLVAPAQPSSGTFDWLVGDRATTTAIVRAEIANGVASATSGVFTLRMGTLTVTSPDASANWTSNSPQETTWISSDLFGSVNISYSVDAGRTYFPITFGTTDDGTFSFIAPNEDSTQVRLYFEAISEGPTAQSDAFAIRSLATVHYVNSTALGLNDGSSWSNAHTSLVAALDAAAPGEEVWVASGFYDSSISVPEGVAVYGGFSSDGSETERGMRDTAAHRPVLTSALAGGVVVMNSDTVLDGFEVLGGDAPVGGGGVFLSGVTGGKINDVRFVSNQAAEMGGAIESLNSELTVSNCLFEGNSAILAGGAMNISGGSVTITDSVFVTNDTGLRGGALHITDTANVLVDRCEFWGQLCDAGGAAYLDAAATLRVRNSLIYENHGARAGAIHVEGGLTLEGSVVAFNGGTLNGGVLEGPAGISPSIRNSIFVANSDSGDLGADLNAAVSNSVLLQTSGYTDLGGNIHAVPTFRNGPGGDFRPAPASVVIDGADGTVAPVTDLDGNPRRDDAGMPNTHTSAVDIGPYEHQGVTNLRVLSPNGDEVLQSGATLQVTWQLAATSSVSISLSTDGGATFANLATGVPGGPGETMVTLPLETSTECIIRVVEQSGLVDTSDRLFTIQ